jgi:YD repeat-containing protein
VTFVVLPGSTDEFTALTFVNNREGSNFQLEQDEDGRWTRVMVYCNDDGIKYYDEYVFTYDDGKRPTGWNHTERETRSGQILVPRETVEYIYDEEDSPNFIAEWKNPDGTVTQRFFQFGRVAYETTSSVEQDSVFFSRQWVFRNDGFNEEYVLDEDGVLIKTISYEIPLSSPSDGRPEDSRKIVLTAKTYEEYSDYFKCDDEGRVIAVNRRFAAEGAPEEQLDWLQYDDEGRVVSWIHQGIEQTYQYDENGFVSKMIKTGDGEWDGTETFEYIPLMVTAQ